MTFQGVPSGLSPPDLVNIKEFIMKSKWEIIEWESMNIKVVEVMFIGDMRGT